MTTPDFDSYSLRACAAAAVAAYPDGWDSYKCGWPDSQLIRFDNETTDTHGFVAIEDYRILISFCGTNNFKNVITDCRIKLKQDVVGRVHCGIRDALDSVFGDILNAIRGRSLYRQLCVTGHSLGGALAMLCASRLMRVGFPVAFVYTFGQPRVGDSAFRDYYNRVLGQNTFRVVHRYDPVPWVPGLLIGYRHAGREIFADADGNFVLDPPMTSKLWRVAKELTAQPFFLFWPIAVLQLINNFKTAVADHSATDYAALVKTFTSNTDTQ